MTAALACMPAGGLTHPDYLRGMTPESWREDVRHLARELVRRHGNPFHFTSRERFDEAVGRLEADLPGLATHQVPVRMFELTAMIGDAHTYIELPPFPIRFPLQVDWVEGDLRVVRVLPEAREALGARLRAIDGVPVPEVRGLLRRVMSQHENESFELVASRWMIVRPDILHTLGVTRAVDRATFLLEDDAGRRWELTAEASPAAAAVRWMPIAAAVPLYMQRPNEAFWFERLPQTGAVYAAFQGYQGLRGHSARLMRLLDSDPAPVVIVDLRLNRGGDFHQGRRHVVEPLGRRLADGRIGQLYVIADRRTFSAAMVNTIDLKKAGATFLGEPPGQRPNSYQEKGGFRLPNSRLGVSVSIRYYRFLDEDVPAFVPDRLITPTWSDVQAGRDPVLDWILEAHTGEHRSRP